MHLCTILKYKQKYNKLHTWNCSEILMQQHSQGWLLPMCPCHILTFSVNGVQNEVWCFCPPHPHFIAK